MSIEPRYNLATKVMSNGVEVIVAGDRKTRPGEPEFLRLLSSTVTRPITLAPHTLSHHMSMMLPAELQSENEVLSSLQPINHFKTKTFHTTFIYPTAVVKGTNTQTVTESTVATNVKEFDAHHSVAKSSQVVTLSSSPVFESQVHKTVYTYLNTIIDDDQPLVATSKLTISNTVFVLSTTPDLEPSETFPETNTYYATREFTRTFTDGTDSQIVSTTDVVTQVVVTDPAQTETMPQNAGTVDVTKTYFVTYTYFSTLLADKSTKVTSHVSVSTDIEIEKFFVKAKKTMTITPTPASLSIIATKTPTAEPLTVETDGVEPSNDLPNDVLEESQSITSTPALKDKEGETTTQGDLIDEWFEQHKMKPSTSTENSRNKLKIKTTFKHKSKTKLVGKTPIAQSATASTYSTSIVMASTVTPQGATLLPGDQVIVFHGESGTKTVIPLTDPSSKKPKNETSVQISDMLSLGALGINSMNVLGPVFNAMAGLLKSQNKEALKRRNDTAPVKKLQTSNPLINFVNDFKSSAEVKYPKTTTARIPVYIPVGSYADDAEPSESEGRIAVLPTPEKWIQEKWPPDKPSKQLDKNRRTHDTNPMALLESGIPISPGQVITTNSDVIIGRPSDSGPRPPNFAVKDNLPIDMKPPPIVEEQRLHHLDSVGQFSTNQGVQPGGRPLGDVEMKPPPKLNRPQKPPLHPLQNVNQPHSYQHHKQVVHDSGAIDLNPPPPPPSAHNHPANIIPIPVHLSANQAVENYVNPVHMHLEHSLPQNIMATPTIPREMSVSKIIDRSSGQAMLVNIQPSQVAQVVIPHGSSTALIISGEQPHSMKGEVIDDPSPHPEPETVGFIGAEPVLKIENSEIPVRHVNSMAEIIKAESVPSHFGGYKKRPPSSIATESVKGRPRPDYDNIGGMQPPSAPILNLPVSNSKKDHSGMYVDISPPGHLPPPHNVQSPLGPIQNTQVPSPENFVNHQSGVVHDVPLNAQVQLGSARPGEVPVQEVLISIKNDKPASAAQFTDEKINFILNADENIFGDLSPPPLPRPGGAPIHDHPINPDQNLHFDHSRPQSYPHIPTPADYMTPPPAPNYGKPPGGPIPINRPAPSGEILVMKPTDYHNEEDDSNDPLHTEDGEEIQESNSRPLLPGQIPREVENLMNNKTSRPVPGGIGVSQTLSFGSSSDKQEMNNVPGLREPETIVGSHIHSPGAQHGEFNNDNEAVVSVGNTPNVNNMGFDMDEAEKMFGMKLPSKNKNKNGSGFQNTTKEIELNNGMSTVNNEEVMGMSPPPLERPRRPQQQPTILRPPFTFEIPAAPTASATPVSVEVDFPPVRSPQLNKKPFKPEDVFPPKLPDNFVHHDYGTSVPNRRPAVTSMPIDSPSSSTTENSVEINGHSKPLTFLSSTELPPNRPKPVIHERPPHIHLQKPTGRPPSRQPSLSENQHNYLSRPGQSNGVQHVLPNASKTREPPFPFHRPEPQPGSQATFVNKVPPAAHGLGGQLQDSVQKPSNFVASIQGQVHANTESRPPIFEQPSEYEKPPSRRPPGYDLPPPGGQPPPRRPPPPRIQHPVPFDHAPSNFDQSHRPTRPIPVGFEKPPQRPSGSGFEIPSPPRGQKPSGFEQSPPRRPLPSSFEKPAFDTPPQRVEPSPHFENQPAQGQPSMFAGRPGTVNKNENKKPPLPYNEPSKESAEEHSDQVPEPTSVYGDRSEDNFVVNNEKGGRRPEPEFSSGNEQSPSLSNVNPPGDLPKMEDRRPQTPPKARPQFKPTPVIKPSSHETSIDDIQHSHRQPTPSFTASLSGNIVTSMVTSGSTTIFGDLYTEPLLLHPTNVFSSSQGVQFTVSSFENQGTSGSMPQNVVVVASSVIEPTHATTMTVTSTLTTVVHAAGKSPSTRTILLTTTIISTIVDKVTETETLVRPTTSTITQTHTISTTRTALVVPTAIYPPLRKYPQPKPEIFVTSAHDTNPKPEIFVADPHDKEAQPDIIVAGDPRDKDTMTISVSSSMNKKEHKEHKEPIDNESILVVVTDKPPPKGKHNGDVVLGAGILSPPPHFIHPMSQTECLPECRPSRNELCVKQEGLMKCVCRPGFARMFPDQPCKPTYTYSMQLVLDRQGGDTVHYQQGLQNPGSPKYVKMAGAAKEGINRLIMQSDLRDIYHGVAITGFMPKEKKTMVDFYVQLSENVEEGKVMGVFKKSLRSSNFSLGGTEMFAARDANNMQIKDFNECLNLKFHDCSEHSRCFNLKGTYTCSCKEGYTDISENPVFPGRLCSDMIGCELCGYHGTCYSREDQQTCECFQWYTGDRCRINLKVLLIALVTIGAILLALLLVCVVMTCLKRRSSNASRANGSSGYLRYRGPPQAMDKRAMIVDTSSESSVENLPYVSPPPPPLPQPQMGPPRKPVLRQMKRPAPKPQQVPVGDQRDRSLTVMIPRVKYRAVPSASQQHVTMSTFSPDKHINRTAQQMDIEQKLINYLDHGSREREAPSSSQRPSKEEKRIYDPKPTNSSNLKKEPRVFEYEYKTSNMHITDGTSSGERRSKDDRFRRYSDQTPLHQETNNLQHRKYSAGALVSAGYAVSATGGLIHDVEESTIHSNTLKSSRSQFTTLNRCGDHKTMSEARSYDETLIQPQTRPLCTNYSGSNSSRHADENHTMVERDLGSTFLLPESHLFKPAGDRPMED